MRRSKSPEASQIAAISRDTRLFSTMRSELGVRISIADRQTIASILAYQARNLTKPIEARQISNAQDQAVMSMSKCLCYFVDELNRQSKLDRGNPERKGYEIVLEAISLKADIDYENGDVACEYHPAIMAEMFRFDDLLCSLQDRLSQSVKGRPRVRAFKFYLFADLGDIFIKYGGKMSASYRPSTGRIEGDFIRFMELLIDRCPSILQHHLRPGLSDDVRTWLRMIDWRNGGEGRKLADLTSKAMREAANQSSLPSSQDLVRKGKKSANRWRT